MLDLGPLKIPNVGITDIDPLLAEGKPIAVTVINGLTAIQLQAFRSIGGHDWNSARHRMRSNIAAEGSTPSEWTGRSGIELQAIMARRNSAGVLRNIPMRVMGCDGPGWLLRGIVTGDEGKPDSPGDWSYGIFEGTIVALSESIPRGTDPSVFLRWPPDHPK